MIGPISMLITGIVLGSMSFKKILSYRRIYMVTAFRLLFFPFIYLLLISVLSRINGFLDNPVLFLVSFLSAMAPAAAERFPVCHPLWKRRGVCELYQHFHDPLYYHFHADSGVS